MKLTQKYKLYLKKVTHSEIYIMAKETLQYLHQKTQPPTMRVLLLKNQESGLPDHQRCLAKKAKRCSIVFFTSLATSGWLMSALRGQPWIKCMDYIYI